MSSLSLLLSELVLESSLSASLGEPLPSAPRDLYSISVHSSSLLSGSILMGISGHDPMLLIVAVGSGSEMTVFSSTDVLSDSGQASEVI